MSRPNVLVPAYTEAENLPLLVPEVLAQDPRIEVLGLPLYAPQPARADRSRAHPIRGVRLPDRDERPIRKARGAHQTDRVLLPRSNAGDLKLTLRITSEVLADWTAGHGVRPRLV